MKKYFVLGLLFISAFIFLSVAPAVLAQSVMDGITCKESGDCQLNDFVVLIVNVSQIILGLVGSLSLLAFVYGGVTFLISAGSSERVTKAKQIITGAVVGLVIVFTSYMIITFVFTALGIDTGSNGWATPGWFTNE